MAGMIEVHCGHCGAKWAQAIPEHPTAGDAPVNVRIHCPYCEHLAKLRAEPMPRRPEMADEWSKPVKALGGAWRMAAAKVGPDGIDCVHFEEGLLRITNDDGWHAAPRDVVLRLLAAEASDRLGWVWEVARRTTNLGTRYWLADCEKGRWEGGGRDALVFEPHGQPVLAPDELLAAMWGRFLLEDALREAGQ